MTLKPSDEIPAHVAAAIQKIQVTHDKNGNPNVTVEMHPKVRALDLLGQHFALWESEKEQQKRQSTNAFLDLLNYIKSPEFAEIAKNSPPVSLFNPPEGVVIEVKGKKIP